MKEVKGEKKIIGVPLEYLVKEEPGVASGDFRTKLHKAENTKVNTKAAFPQAKPRGEQVDFRTVLKRSGGPERKQFRSGGSAQTDFRDSLKRKPKVYRGGYEAKSCCVLLHCQGKRMLTHASLCSCSLV